VTLGEDSLVYGTKNSVHTYHDKMDYERVMIFLIYRDGFNILDLLIINIWHSITSMEVLKNGFSKDISRMLLIEKILEIGGSLLWHIIFVIFIY
tara:strand:- start:100 stop:381 length:282 start_codon:yes stop_codon:yes gene_type:complete